VSEERSLTAKRAPAQCPRGHKGDGVYELASEIGGHVEDAVHCDACPADYVCVGSRWFEAPSSTEVHRG
jgi:hypothetical protein